MRHPNKRCFAAAGALVGVMAAFNYCTKDQAVAITGAITVIGTVWMPKDKPRTKIGGSRPRAVPPHYLDPPKPPQ